MDNIVNSGGIKLIPEKIESKLAAKMNRRFFVAGIPDTDLGEKLVLIVEGEDQNVDKEIFDCLDKYEKPKEVFFVSQFVETANGKVKRKETVAAL